jgi:hypothetical protein
MDEARFADDHAQNHRRARRSLSTGARRADNESPSGGRHHPPSAPPSSEAVAAFTGGRLPRSACRHNPPRLASPAPDLRTVDPLLIQCCYAPICARRGRA